MDRLIDEITDRYLDRLPEDRQYHTADELRGLDMPDFLTRRILLQVRRHLLESFPEPRSEWADLQSPEVDRRWEDFLISAENTLRLPNSRTREVFREAVEGCLELLVRPRETIPRLLFGSDRELDRDRLKRRLSFLVVYPHFYSLLPRYMEKKELESLDRDRCASIISRADRKLCRRYDEEGWVDLLDPLFELTGGRVPSKLLADFFRDKEMSGMAERLEKRNGRLERGELMRLLSTGGSEEAPSPEAGLDHSGSSSREIDSATVPGQESPGESDESHEDNLNTLFSQEVEAGEREEAVEEAMDQAAEEEEPTPMWMRYLDPREAERLERQRLEKEKAVERFAPEVPGNESEEGAGLGEAAREDQTRSDEVDRMEKHLADERDYFVEELFGGSEGAYDRALEEVASREDWPSASRYIGQEIFKRNLVDMYSKPAVEFTDRLQSWFMDSSKTESQ